MRCSAFGSGAAPFYIVKLMVIGANRVSSSGAAPEPNGARWSTEGGSYEPLWSSSGQLHTIYLVCSTLLHLLWSHPRAAHPNFPYEFTLLAPLLRSSSTNHQFYNVKWSCTGAPHLKTLICNIKHFYSFYVIILKHNFTFTMIFEDW